MSIFHHHDKANDETVPQTYEILGEDGRVRRYAREAFDMIVETTDTDEVAREVARGWVILDERQITSGGRGPSGADLLTGIEGLRAGGVLGYERDVAVTRYTIAYLRDGAAPEEG